MPIPSPGGRGGRRSRARGCPRHPAVPGEGLGSVLGVVGRGLRPRLGGPGIRLGGGTLTGGSGPVPGVLGIRLGEDLGFRGPARLGGILTQPCRERGIGRTLIGGLDPAALSQARPCEPEDLLSGLVEAGHGQVAGPPPVGEVVPGVGTGDQLLARDRRGVHRPVEAEVDEREEGLLGGVGRRGRIRDRRSAGVSELVMSVPSSRRCGSTGGCGLASPA